MNLRARVHIGNRTMSRGDAAPVMQIEDCTSGIRIAEIHWTPADFGELIAGMGFVECDMQMVGEEGFANLGMKKQLEHIQVPKSLLADVKWDQKDEVIPSLIDGYLRDNPDLIPPVETGQQPWRVWSYGQRTQQPSREWHNVILFRYVPVEEQ